MIPKSSYLCPWGNGTIGESEVGDGWLGWSFSCLTFVFLFLLTYPRLTLIITGKKFFPFKIAITPSSFHCGSQTVLELQLFLLHVLCINQDNYQECGHFLCYTKLCHLHICLIFTSRPFDIIHALCCIKNLQIACEQALWGALVVGREKEEELSTIYVDLEFEYLHRKSQCEMLIGRDVISNGVITLGTCFQCLFMFTLVSDSHWLAEIWALSRLGATGELDMDSNSTDVVASSPSFCYPATRACQRAWS